MQDFDVVVIGGGTAGFTAGLFAARQGLKVMLAERLMVGGQIINIEKIEDYPGFPEGISGAELGGRIQEQAMNAGCEFQMAEITDIAQEGQRHLLTTSEGPLRAKAVIVAGGSSLRKLGIPGEDELEGKGVSHCATCDGPFFMGQTVAVVGGGDSAADEAHVLTQFAEKVILVHRRDQLSAQHALRERVRSNPKVQIRWNTVVTEAVGGDGGLQAVRVKDTKTFGSSELPVKGLFIYVGLEPNSGVLPQAVKRDGGGHIVTDLWMRTTLPGVYAIGDIRQHSASQVVTGAGDGATAAIHAFRYISGKADWKAYPSLL